MPNQPVHDLIDELDALLDSERETLAVGNLDQLTRMLSRKEQLFDQINAVETLERGRLAQVHSKVSRNQELLNSALEGIRAVADRMADLRRVRKGLETYDQTGRKTRFEIQVTSNVEKHA